MLNHNQHGQVFDDSARSWPAIRGVHRVGRGTSAILRLGGYVALSATGEEAFHMRAFHLTSNMHRTHSARDGKYYSDPTTTHETGRSVSFQPGSTRTMSG